MAVADDFPGDLRKIAAALGFYLSEMEAPLAIAEKIQVWPIALKDLKREGGVANARFQGLWHLQLRPGLNLPARAFARVRVLNGVAEVQAFYFSRLAGQLDKAIGVVDQRYKNDRWRVRLLEVPDIHITVLWLSGLGGDRMMYLDDPIVEHWRVGDEESAEAFRTRFLRRQPIRGIEPRSD